MYINLILSVVSEKKNRDKHYVVCNFTYMILCVLGQIIVFYNGIGLCQWG